MSIVLVSRPGVTPWFEETPTTEYVDYSQLSIPPLPEIPSVLMAKPNPPRLPWPFIVSLAFNLALAALILHVVLR